MRALVREAGLEHEVEVDSAGTGGWHVGEPPDRRATAAAKARGLTLEGAAREVTVEDFVDFDLLLAMDSFNEDALLTFAPGDVAREKVGLLREYDPASPDDGDLDVPDPYYGGDDGFEHVLDLVRAACEGLLEQIRRGEIA